MNNKKEEWVGNILDWYIVYAGVLDSFLVMFIWRINLKASNNQEVGQI